MNYFGFCVFVKLFSDISVAEFEDCFSNCCAVHISQH